MHHIIVLFPLSFLVIKWYRIYKIYFILNLSKKGNKEVRFEMISFMGFFKFALIERDVCVQNNYIRKEAEHDAHIYRASG